jgi:hypothetical protein
MGPSNLGDLGSAAWNITHRDAAGSLHTWGSGLYVSSRTSNPLAVLRHSPAVPYYCPKGRTSLAGFDRPGTVTVAVVCRDPHVSGKWWTVFQRVDRLTYLVVATDASSRAEAVVNGRSVFTSLTTLSQRVNLRFGVLRPAPEPSG